jgi:hypothetical protein
VVKKEEEEMKLLACCLAVGLHAAAAAPDRDDQQAVALNASHPHPPCCKGCPKGPCTACRTPGKDACCPCLPKMPPLPPCGAPETCLQLSTKRGYGVGLGVLDALVFAGGFKGNQGLDAIDIYNTTSASWSHAKMSTGRTLFDGAALGRTAIFGCGEGGGGGTADILDVPTGKVTTVKLAGGSRKKCAATAVVLARDAAGVPTEGKILIGGGYKSVAVDIWDLKTGKWSVSKMSISHFYMAAASAGPFSLFCGGLAPSGDTSICDVYDARGAGSWSVTHLVAPVREISATSIDHNGKQLAVFMGGGHTQVFDAKTAAWTFRNATPGRSPWAKMGRATVAGQWAVFGGGNGNGKTIEIFDSETQQWSFAKQNLSIGREQVMGAGTASGVVGFAGGTIGAYNPTGYIDRVDLFHIQDLL